MTIDEIPKEDDGWRIDTEALVDQILDDLEETYRESMADQLKSGSPVDFDEDDR